MNFHQDYTLMGGYHTVKGEHCPSKPASLIFHGEGDIVVLRVEQPGWDYNRRCFVELSREQLLNVLEDVKALLQ